MIIPKFIYEEIIECKQKEARIETERFFQTRVFSWFMNYTANRTEFEKKQLAKSLSEWGLLK